MSLSVGVSGFWGSCKEGTTMPTAELAAAPSHIRLPHHDMVTRHPSSQVQASDAEPHLWDRRQRQVTGNIVERISI